MTHDLDAVRARTEGVERYNVCIGNPYGDYADMELADKGSWVRVSDYDVLAAEVETNRATIAGLEIAVEIARDQRDRESNRADTAQATIAALKARVEALTEMVGRAAVWVPQDVRSWHADRAALSQKDTPDAR